MNAFGYGSGLDQCSVQDRGTYSPNMDGTTSVTYPGVQRNLTSEEREANLEYVKAKTENIKLENAKLTMEVNDSHASPDEAQVYPFFGEVEPATVARFIQTSGLWSRRNPTSDITIMLSSPGGDVVSGLAMHDYIVGLRNRGHVVTIKVLSMAASMAAIILQAGSHRIMGSSALMMLHEGGAQLVGSRSNITDSQKALDMMDLNCQRALCGRSGMTPRKYKGLIRRKDCWLSATEALDLGLVDEVSD